MPTTSLNLRKVTGHPQAQNAYRVICENVEAGSIGPQFVAGGPNPIWAWGIDTVLPKQRFVTYGQGADRDDCMQQFRKAWNVFVSDPARYARFMEMKRQRF